MKVTYGAIVQRASGRFGGTVHSNWKGVDVVRRFAKPSNPNSTAQQNVRFAFRNLTTAFLTQPANLRAAWNSYVLGKPLINRNAWLGKNVPWLADNGEPSGMNVTPGDSSTLPPAAYVATGGVGQITTVFTAPTIPTGWTIVSAVAVAVFDDTDWNTDVLAPGDCQFYEGTDDTAPYTGAVITIPAGFEGTYHTWGFFKWLAPDGSTRYSSAVYGGTEAVT